MKVIRDNPRQTHQTASDENANAIKLAKTGAMPQGTWGAAAFGAPPSRIRQLRGLFVDGLGCTTGGKCYTTALAVEYGQESDPAITTRMEHVWEWASIWYRLKPRQR